MQQEIQLSIKRRKKQKVKSKKQETVHCRIDLMDKSQSQSSSCTIAAATYIRSVLHHVLARTFRSLNTNLHTFTIYFNFVKFMFYLQTSDVYHGFPLSKIYQIHVLFLFPRFKYNCVQFQINEISFIRIFIGG